MTKLGLDTGPTYTLTIVSKDDKGKEHTDVTKGWPKVWADDLLKTAKGAKWFVSGTVTEVKHDT
jgi:hypothetical protein